MEILQTPAEMRAWREAHRGSLGLTPTMGYLHEGHLALVRRSLAENEVIGGEHLRESGAVRTERGF